MEQVFDYSQVFYRQRNIK